MNGDEIPEQPGSIVSGLMDFRFRQMVTPRLIGCLYLAAVSFIGSGTLFTLLFLWGLTTWAGSGWWWFVPVVLAGGFMAVLSVRVLLEWVLMAFTRGRPQGRLRDGR